MKCEIVEGELVATSLAFDELWMFQKYFFLSFSTTVLFIPSINGEGLVASVCDPPMMFTACSSQGIQLIHF